MAMKLEERCIEEKFCDKVGKTVCICQQYHPTLNVKVGEEFCNNDICNDKACPYHQEGKKV